MRYVFISHADSDKALIKPLLDSLLEARIPIWIDRPSGVGLAGHPLVLSGIRAGADWHAEIRRAYEGADCILYCLSRNSNDSVRNDLLFRELDHGIVTDKLLIAKVDDIGVGEMSGFIRIRQSIDVSGTAPDHPTRMADLMTGLQRFLQQPGATQRDGGPMIRPRLTGLRPYLCDRRTQSRRFKDAVETELEGGVTRPHVVFVAGEDSQCADKFIEQLYCVDLPDILQRHDLPGPVESRLIRWPVGGAPLGEEAIDVWLAELESEIKEKLGLKRSAGKAGIERRLKEQNAAMFIYFDVSMQRWGKDQRSLLGAWMEWWGGLDLSGRRYPLVIMGRFCLGKALPLLGHDRTLSRLSHDLKSLGTQAGAQVITSTLPHLDHVSYEDVSLWIDENRDVTAHASAELREKLGRFFQAAWGFGQKKVPMSEAARFLRSALDKITPATEI